MRKMHQTSTPGLHNSSQFLISKAVLSADQTTIWDLYLRISLIQSLNCRNVYFLPYSENLTLFTDIISKPNSVWMDVPALLDLAGLNIENIMESDWRFFLQTHDGGSTAKQKHVADFFANKWRLRNQQFSGNNCQQILARMCTVNEI